MLTFISCAKTMDQTSTQHAPHTTAPRYEDLALENAFEMAQFSIEELMKALHINRDLAIENHRRYLNFGLDERQATPSIEAYTGVVFKHINPHDFSREDFLFAQDHLRITSFLYGLLRPLDRISNYRMEGAIRLQRHDEKTQFDFWKPHLTPDFLDEIHAQDNTLINLASAEMKQLFFWSQIKKQARIITPEFRVWKNGKPTSVVVYAKMCRGEMTRYIIKNRINKAEQLKAFEWEGFRFDPELSNEEQYFFTLR